MNRLYSSVHWAAVYCDWLHSSIDMQAPRVLVHSASAFHDAVHHGFYVYRKKPYQDYDALKYCGFTWDSIEDE